MSKARKTTGIITAATATIAVGIGAFVFVSGVNAQVAEQPATVNVVSDYGTEADTTVDYLQAARDSKAAREEAARVAAEQKAAEEAAVLAAAQEAERVAAEQAAAEQAAAEAVIEEEPVWEEPVAEEPAPEQPANDLTPLPWVDAGNGTGYWDTSACPTGSGMTGPDGGQYCYTG